MFESFIEFMLSFIGGFAILMGVSFVIASQMDYQARLKSGVDECQKALKALQEMIQQNKQG